ncbi:porin [Paraburkholderia saeva]|uniref:Outer membrane porin protein 32 n=1 Tax=Paraburkholderia saeva TaxID=2777537 RepID=A0A9N8RSU5_9BURK|nr:porin [Paraburkholderia saeva]CAG4886992.1 Outer membrane porin protein 32 [Paraburkholderia saeva]CAG4886998.1 Outer membrane porin protein 32 [Paraburkholderia saeva]
MRFSDIGKGIFGASLIAAAGTAMADTNVTLYGVVDVFGQYLGNGGTHTFSEGSGGSTGSLFGLKGSEDLGGGLKADFDVENGFNINNGTPYADTTTLFYRQAWVGLSDGNYGSVSFGRQYQPSFRVVYPTDPFRANENLSPLSAAVLAIDRNTLATQFIVGRTSNSVLYQSPNLRGVQFSAMYGFAATVTQPIPETLGNMVDLGLSYTGYGLYAGIGYQNQHAAIETFPGLPEVLNMLGTEHFIGALAYRLGIVNFQFNYSYARPKDAPAGSLAALLDAGHSVSTMELGVTIQATPADTIEVAGIERDVRGAHDNTPGVQIGIDHSISKRTSVYMRAGYLKNNGTATTSWPGVAVTEAAATQTLAVVGMTHRF